MVDQVDKSDQTSINGQRPRLERGIDLSDNARTVLEKRYLRKGPDGKPAETIEEMFWRVSWHVAEPEEAHGQDRQAVAEQFYDLLTSKRFFPNSPTFTGAGTPLGQLAACFVLAIDDDMGREEEGIFQTLRNAALIQQTGGGNGFSFSRLRPKGARVSSSNGEATGPVGFLRVYDQAFGEIAQGGCLVPDTLVMTDRGLLRLDEIVTHREPGTWDEHELRVATDEGWRRSGASYNNGVARVLRVTTDAGLELTGTPNHKVKVMTDSGPEWRALEDLQPGDAILVKLGQYMPTSASQELPFPTEQHKKLDNDLALELGRAAGGAQVDGAIRELLVRNRLLTGSRMAEVPRAIRCSPHYVVDAFLRGLYEARQVPGLPGVDSLDPAFAKQVAILLIGLGYPAAIEVRDGAATVKIVEKETVPDFSGPSILDYHDSPFGVVCPQCAVDDLWFVTVEAVEDAGEALTLDLEVDGNHTYLANGLVTHNSRRGANMGVLRVDHPDIEEFITAKAEEGQIENFNISVAVTDAFMQAVKDDKDFNLINPQDGTVWKTVRARDLFEKIVRYAHHNGEPGMLFIDAANRDNPVPHLYELEATNPCVTGDTLVATPSGWRRADEFRVGDEICTVLGTGRVASIEVHETMPVYRVEFSDGSSVRVTAAHQFHARDSRTKFFEPRRTDQLKEGMWVRVFRAAIPDNPVPQGCVELDDREYGFLVGVLVGDGTYTEHGLSKNVVRVSSHVGDDEWNAILEEAFSRVGVPHVYTYVNEGTRSMMMDPKPGRVVADWVKSLPLPPARSHEKRLPECYINSNREFLEGLLDGLFSTDGSVDLSSNHPLVRFHTASEELAQQVRRILLMFGIHGRVCRSKRRKREFEGRVIRYDRPKYDVIISGESFGRFFEQIKLSHPEKQYRMEEAALRCNFTGGNWAAKVKKIEFDGFATVYDLYEPRSDTWITEGYVSRGCGEQWLGPFENCCLGSVNLAQHVTPEGQVDWEKLRETVELSTRFLDDVVDANKYVPAVPQLEVAAHRVRRIGLGIMGLSDLMYRLGVRYGSEEGQEFAAQIMEFVHYHCMRTSVDLSRDRGPFLAIRGSRFDPDDLKWEPPAPLKPYERDWGRPSLDWQGIVEGIKRHGIRNGAHTTIAPTGTISTVAGVEGYGCEPVFALAYVRYFDDKGTRRKLQYTSPLFQQALIDAGLDEATRQRIIEQVNATGSCQNVPEVPDEIKRVFVVASDITAEEHVLMQAVLQRFVSNSISKTCNFPSTATEKDVADAFMQAWELGCKGLTVYVAGTREKVVLETAETARKRQSQETAEQTAPAASTAPAAEPASDAELPLFGPEKKKPRARVLPGWTYRLETPLGTMFVTVNENGESEPFEVFMHTSKAGSETAAVSEAMGRLISYILRLRSPVPPHERLKEVVRQLEGIGGGRSLGLGPNRVRSLPDGIAQVLMDYLADRQERAEQGNLHARNHEQAEARPASTPAATGQMAFKFGDLCPECGQAAVVNEEGCRKCYACGYSEC